MIHCRPPSFFVIALFGCLYTALNGYAFSQAPAGRTDDVQVRPSRVTGLATFVTPNQGEVIPVAPTGGVAAILPEDFLEQYGHLFGIVDHGNQLAVAAAGQDPIGFTTTTYHQYHQGVRVFAGVVKVHQRPDGAVSAANGAFFPIPAKLITVPTLTAREAAALAMNELDAGQPFVESAELVIVDPGWYGDPPIGAHLAYYVILTDPALPLREAFFIDAHEGDILDRWSMIHTAMDRRIHDAQNASVLPGVLARSEGQGPVMSPEDVNRAYDYAGDTYGYFYRAFGRDSINGAGLPMIATVNATFQAPYPNCPNAFWNGQQIAFCDGLVTDDIIGHEFVHGITQYTAGLIYQNQSGQLNEAYSDIFGELIDLFNGNAAFAGAPGGPAWPTHPTGPGVDTPNNLRTTGCTSAPSYVDGVRWMMGENATAFSTAIRDMWNPPCRNHPDYNNSPLQTCPGNDAGGVHSGSGIANHSFAMLTDGKTFNGYTVTGIGPIKAGAVWYRALTTYLTPSSDYQDAYYALNQAAQDLIGTTPNDPRTGLPSASAFTASDALEVDKACLAVEMNTDGACGATVPVLNPTPPTECDKRIALFTDDFEGGTNGWAVENSNPPTPYNWVQTTMLPPPMSGTAWFCADPNLGDCGANDESGTHSLISPVIQLPPALSLPTIAFTHYIATEGGWDGGNMRIRVNGGTWQLVPLSAFNYNPYNTNINLNNNTNPLAGQPGWTGAGGGWGVTLLDLRNFVTGGDTFQVRFDFGKDGCTGNIGWYVAEFRVYDCPCTNNAACDDGVGCNGTETCVGGVCQPGTPLCPPSLSCDETTLDCVLQHFAESFENGNVQGWTLHATGSTATAGAWVFGDPNGTIENGQQAQPETGVNGTLCAFTGQNASLGDGDVDNGVTYLLSPTINLSGQTEVRLSYWRWFYNRDQGEDANDFFRVEASSNNGGSWVTVENLGTNVNANAWTPRSYDLQAFIPLTSTVRLRFACSDGGTGTFLGNLIECAVDEVVLGSVAACLTSADCVDGNPCTNDVCTGGVCSHPDNSLPCDDGLFCTTNDVCSGGTCVGGPSGCAQFCDEATDQCVACLSAIHCNDGIACTQDACIGGACQNVANDALCDDGLFCTGVESCSAQSGCSSSGNPCDAPELCDEINDACLCPAPSATGAGSRHVAITPASGSSPVALRVRGDADDPAVACVDQYVQADGSLGATPVFQTPAAWGVVYVGDGEIRPLRTYAVNTVCGSIGSPNPSPTVESTTARFGEMTGDAFVNLDDILRVLAAFGGAFAPGTTVEHYDLMPCTPDGLVTLDDILAELSAFSGAGLNCPAVCP